ncbi:hypothetical protein [Streptomyces sp. SYSU K21746]
MDPGTHFAFGTHKQHGFVAAFTSSMPGHLAHWFLVREQFEPVPGEPGLFRLTDVRLPLRDSADGSGVHEPVLHLQAAGLAVGSRPDALMPR